MLRTGLRRVTDRWAVALTATGSVASIALNVAGVSGTGNAGDVPPLDYVVAAVPPTAALLAFGVLMRQIHQFVERPPAAQRTSPNQVPDTLVIEPEPAAADEETTAVPPAYRPEPPTGVPESRPRGGRPAGATIDELVGIARVTAAEHGKLTRSLVREAVRDEGLTIGNDRITEVINILKAERGAAPVSG